MIIENQKMIKRIINKVLKIADNVYQLSDIGCFSEFIRLYFIQASSEDLVDRSTKDLYGLVRCHWEVMKSKPEHSNMIRLYSPSEQLDEWQSTHTIIQIAANDMPFLVDSIRMEIDRLNINNYLMIYMGGMTIERDDQHRIVNVGPYSSEEGAVGVSKEAPIHVEIGRQVDTSSMDEIKNCLEKVIDDVSKAVADWRAMRSKMRALTSVIKKYHSCIDKDSINEAIEYLNWLLDDNFTFLGMRDYVVAGAGEKMALELVPSSGLGVLQDETRSKKVRYFAELPVDVRKLMLTNKHLLVITKTNTRSTVHRPGYTDYIGVKQFNEKGKLIGETRFIGLYTSIAYLTSPYDVPILRKKVEKVFKKSGFPYRSHAGKDLAHILTGLPRDDLFQASVKQLLDLSLGVLHMQERRIIRLFVRKDVYRRFMSALIYLPREKFTMELIRDMQKILQSEFQGTEVDFTTQLTSSILVQVHFVVRLSSKKDVDYDFDSIERKLILAGLSWKDKLVNSINKHFPEVEANRFSEKYGSTFPAGYRERFSPDIAVKDIQFIEDLGQSDTALGMNAYRTQSQVNGVIRLKLYRWNETVPLSDVLPMLESMGLRVIAEHPYQLIFASQDQVWINDLKMECKEGCGIDFDVVKDKFQQTFYQVWLGKAEDDALNSLTLFAKLSWRQIVVLRAYAKYFQQIGIAYSQSYIYDSLIHHPKIASLLIDYFISRFDCRLKLSNRERVLRQIEGSVLKALDQVKMLDEDRILRRYLMTMMATVRTNYFHSSCQDGAGVLSLKFHSSAVPDIVSPVPAVEIFVYSPDFEGIHLRFDKVARGGLRWSDRPEDFRTEILGLSKAQQVKNALIVPAGAKGGFVPKNIPVGADRDTVMQLGVGCYKRFINGLLDCVDNLEDDQVVTLPDTIVYDGEDPYLVVAADKGTATFSDIANGIAVERQFWLGDAFASGGSTGYDHKKIGITARGTWISARRHFQEQGMDIEQSEVSVVGIGDMAGDVFGNGLLMSDKIKLIAAFNHRHIFIDPNPENLLACFAERLRLFNLPRSAWADYNVELLSPGGGVYSRADKMIVLSEEAQLVLGADKAEYFPVELIKLILKISVDMIWNGGIGTFVKSTTENHSQVGDRHNDDIRVNGNELRAKIFCEGGNLGLTQKARIEYALNGGRINTDFIDNSAGVDCSDHEVNMKILLNAVVRKGVLTVKQRNQLLKKLTDEVSSSVLYNNYQQNRLIAQAVHISVRDMNAFIGYISQKEKDNHLNRQLECLASTKELRARKVSGQGLTRPEASTLIANSKNIIESKLKASAIPDNSYYVKYIKKAFPKSIRRRFADDINAHRLAREIICNQLSNQMVTDMGFDFLFQMQNELDVSIENVVNAYSVAIDIFHLSDLMLTVQSYDHRVDVKFQYKMKDRIVMLIRRVIRWLVDYTDDYSDIGALVGKFKPHLSGLFRRIPSLLMGRDKEAYIACRDELIHAGVDELFAKKVAIMPTMYHSLSIIDASVKASKELAMVSRYYFNLIQRLDLIWFRDIMDSYVVTNHWTALAKSGCKSDLDCFQSVITVGSLLLPSQAKSVTARVDEWIENNQFFLVNWNKILDQLRASDSVDFAVISVAMKTLSNLAMVYNDGNVSK